MALDRIKFNIASFNDADAGGNNYYAGIIYEVFNSNDTLADIYSDAAGANPINQDGISNKSNSSGEVAFYIDSGDYYIKVNEKVEYFSTLLSSGALINDLSLPYVFDTTDEFAIHPNQLPAKKSLQIKEDSTGTGGGSTWDIVSGQTLPVSDDVINSSFFDIQIVRRNNTELYQTKSSVLAYEPVRGISPKKESAIVRVSPDEYLAYMHLGGETWQTMTFSNNGLDGTGKITPFNWTSTTIEDKSEALVFGDSGVSVTGSWTDLSTVNAAPYYGHRAAQTTTIGDYIEFTVEGAGGTNLTLMYNSRIEGNIVDVLIDGSTALVNENTTVDTYSPTTEYRNTALIATNLPAKTTPYIVRVTLSASKNASASTAFNICGINALILSGELVGEPWKPSVRPTPFISTAPIAVYEEVVGVGGNIYVCTVAGNTGSTPPSHASGSEANGTAILLRLQQTSFSTNEDYVDTIHSKGSQLEYAYEFKKSGDATYQDVGGNLHGNEFLQKGLEIFSGGVPRDIITGRFITGHNLQIKQTIRAYYGTDLVNEPLADTSLVHSLHDGKVVVSHESEYLMAGNFGYHYPAMLPLTAYNAVSFKKVFDKMYTSLGGEQVLEDYSGISNPIVGKSNDLQMSAIGEIYRPVGAAGVPVDGSGVYKIATNLRVTNFSVNDYKYSSTVKAGMATNLSGATAMSGYSSWAIKKYFARSNIATPEPVTVGKVIRSEAEYSVNLVRR